MAPGGAGGGGSATGAIAAASASFAEPSADAVLASSIPSASFGSSAIPPNGNIPQQAAFSREKKGYGSDESVELLVDLLLDRSLQHAEHEGEVDRHANGLVGDRYLTLGALRGAARRVEADRVALPLPFDSELFGHALGELFRLLLGVFEGQRVVARDVDRGHGGGRFYTYSSRLTIQYPRGVSSGSLTS